MTGRTLLLRMRDRGQALFMAMQATAFPVLMVLVFGYLAPGTGPDVEQWAKDCGNLTTVHFLLVVAAIWFGVNNAARDVVGEWAIFQRERMVSLKLPSYVLAKVTVLGLISMAQCLVLLGIVSAACGLQAPFFDVYVTLLLASQAGAALGLLISALSRTTESAIAFLPIPLLFMILLGGGIKPLHEMPPEAEAFSKVFPARWAFEANIQMEAERRPRMGGTAEGVDVAETVFPVKTGGRERSGVGFCLGMLSVMWSGLLALVLGVLRRRDIH